MWKPSPEREHASWTRERRHHCCAGWRDTQCAPAAVLIKDNHLAAVDGDIALAVSRARAVAPAGIRVEVECDTLDQVRAAIDAGADVIMLDNMRLMELRQAVELIDH